MPSINIINREGWMISKKISLRSPFPDLRGYAASVRVARCYVPTRVELN
jgi:hypothetical protein